MSTIDRRLEFKLLIEKKSQKVVFAEVGKDVVDFLLSLFALPMGSVINLITKDATIGSLGNMYQRWDQLDGIFLHSTKMKASCLIPAISSPASEPSNFAHLLSSANPASVTGKLYICTTCTTKGRYYFTDVLGGACKHCFYMKTIYQYEGPNITKEEVSNGYVKSGLTYAVMDDLSMVPLTESLASISLLNKLGHNNLSQLERKSVILDVKTEGLELLKTSLWSKNVLTEVLLAKQKEVK